MAKTKKLIKATVAKSKTLLKKKTTKTVKKSSAETAAKAAKTAKAVTADKAQETPKAAKIICIDYPTPNETVYCGHYCFRLGSLKEVPYMRVSVNGGPWQECRRANGYWWFDWWNFQTGSFTLEASSEYEGKPVKTAKRKFKVTL